MKSPKFNPACSLFLCALLAIGCGAGRVGSSGRLPANVMVDPEGTVGIITASTEGTLAEMMVALGVPFEKIPLDGLAKADLDGYAFLVIDEGTLDDPRAALGYSRLVQHVSKGASLLILRQSIEGMQKLRARVRDVVSLRDVDYDITIRLARYNDPIVRVPNLVTRADLDSLSRTSRQLAHGGSEARALLAANVQYPDSSATLLWEPTGDGTIWYCSFPIVARAAAGFEAEQKIAANILSQK